MNAKDISKYLRISVGTVKKILISGKLKGIKTFKGWETTKEEVNNYLKKYEQ